MTPQRKKARYSKLFVDGEVVRHPEMLLNVWVSHFWLLAKSRLEDKGKDLQEKIKGLENQNEEFLLDVPFTAEVSRGVARLEKRRPWVKMV